MHSDAARAQRFWRWHLFVPLAVWIAGLIVFETSDLDLYASDAFYDFHRHRWPVRDIEWIERVFHDGGKYLILLIGAGAFLVWVLALRVERLARWRRAALYLALCIALSTATVRGLKFFVDRHYPVHIERYGGTVPYTRLFEPAPSGFGHEGGFPAAHAAGAMSLCALYFIARARGRARPWRWLLPAIVLGVIYAGVQQARGMHYLSHNWWSAGICWLIALELYVAFGRDL